MRRKPVTGKAKTARTARRPAPPKRTEQPNALEVLAAASAEALGLPVEATWQGEVKRNLQLLLKHAALVDEFSLSDESEPAPVFRA